MSLKICVSLPEICLEIEDVAKFDTLLRQEGHSWKASTALKIPKIRMFKFRKIKGFCVEKMQQFFLIKATFNHSHN